MQGCRAETGKGEMTARGGDRGTKKTPIMTGKLTLHLAALISQARAFCVPFIRTSMIRISLRWGGDPSCDFLDFVSAPALYCPTVFDRDGLPLRWRR